MSKILAYVYENREVQEWPEFFDVKSKTITQFKKSDVRFQDSYKVFDTIALAAEAGVLDTDTWVKQLFASKAAFKEFAKLVSTYDSSFRLHDRWWQALGCLVGGTENEAGFLTSEEIANELIEHAEETRQV